MSEIEVRKLSDGELEEMGVNGWPIWECDPSRFDWEYTDKEKCVWNVAKHVRKHYRFG